MKRLNKVLSIALIGLMIIPTVGWGKKNVMINDMNKKEIAKVIKKDKINKTYLKNDILEINITKDTTKNKKGKKVTKDIVVVKMRTEPSYNNAATIKKQYYDIEDISNNLDLKKTKELQVWCIAEMTDGSDDKVFAATISNKNLKAIKDQDVLPNDLEAMTSISDDLYILPSLTKDVDGLVLNE